METRPSNPNEALTPIYVGDRLVFVPVIDFYLYNEHPELIISKLALEEMLNESGDNERA